MSMREQLQKLLYQYEQDIRAEATRLRREPMPVLTETLFSLYEITGNRLQYEEKYFLRRKYLLVFGMASVLWHRKEDILMLEEVIQGICSEVCWALPAHVNRENNDWQITIDLFASETAQSLSEIFSLLNLELSKKIQDLVREQVYRRVLEPFYQSESPYADWERGTNNWCAVCAGSIGSAAIYLMNDNEEKLNTYLDRIVKALKWYMKGFPADGTCMEGLGYYTYGMTYFTGFAEQLFEYTHGEINLLAAKKCTEIAAFQQKCYFTGGATLSFSDGSSREKFRIGLTCYLASHFKEVEVPDLALAAGVLEDPCARWMGAYRDYSWTKKYMVEPLQAQAARNPFEILPDAQWAVFQSASGAVLAAKGGNNGEPHNHNDVGSFLYMKEGEMLLEDLGAGEYTKEYFGEGRYEILCNSSLGHNVPIVNNRFQKAGKQYTCDNFKGDGEGNILISYGKAYGDDSLDSLIRMIHFVPSSGVTRIEDRFWGIKNKLTAAENLVTRYEPVINKNEILIRGRKASIRIQFEEYLGEIHFLPNIHTDHEGKEQRIWLIQWEVPVKDGYGGMVFYIK